MRRKLLWWLLGLFAAIAVAAVAFGLARTRYEEGGFAPVISPDGKYAWFVRRATSGFVWGLGVEFFTPPAHAFIWRDRFELCRIPMQGGSVETVVTWPHSPLERTSISEYRGRIFSVSHSVLRFTDSRLVYEVAITVPQSPQSVTWALEGQLDSGAPGQAQNVSWTRRFTPAYPGEDSVRDPWEVLAAPGRENFPCAIVTHDFHSGQLRVLWKTSACDALYPGGIRWERLAEYSRAADILRLRRVRQLSRDLVAEGRARGETEMQASLSAIRRLQDMGYYPKPPRLVARPLRGPAEASVPLFRISGMQFKVGLFPDIENAIAAPGTEVDKNIGTYAVHQDYTTSTRLNEFLASGGQRFYVETAGRLYELTLTKPTSAVR
jgi:hypothetical protein